jgi:hypothetical protein
MKSTRCIETRVSILVILLASIARNVPTIFLLNLSCMKSTWAFVFMLAKIALNSIFRWQAIIEVAELAGPRISLLRFWRFL